MAPKQYKKMDPISHCLERPDMYVGSTNLRITTEYVAELDPNDDTGGGYKIFQQDINNSPAILRIFIEVLSNAIDNVERSRGTKTPCKRIEVSINEDTGETSVWNDGDVVPIEINEEEGCYNHTMIFGQLLTGSNYDDEQERIVAGRNGIGAKACSIFSKKFIVEGCDPTNKKMLTQTWTNNMRTVTKPVIRVCKQKGYTKVTWWPDFVRFGLEGYTSDLVKLYTRYVIDAAMISKVQVFLNDVVVPVKSLIQYAPLYDVPNEEKLLIKTPACEVMLTPNMAKSGQFEAISFVNGVYTRLGGQHVDAWSEAIFRPIVDKFNGKDKKTKTKQPKINIGDVRQFFRLFVVATVVRPEFNGQNKEKLESPTVATDVKTTHINAVWKWSVMEHIEDIIKTKEMVALKKVSNKQRQAKVEGLDPANNSGGKQSHECSLFICEGLSAKTYVVAGIDEGVYGKKGRDWFGILPVTGKILNVRNATPTSIAANKVIVSFIQSLGLQYGVDYTKDSNYKTLRYGKVIAITDADCFTGDTPIVIKTSDGCMDIVSMESLYNMGVDQTEIWSDKGWTPITGIKQKSSTKSIVEIYTHCGLVTCTEDHECMLEDGTSIKAKDILVGHKLLRTRRIEPPTSTTHNMRDIAKELQCHKSSVMDPEELSKSIEFESNLCHDTGVIDTDYGIEIDEAWVWGLFFAEGTCDIYTFTKDREKATESNTIKSRTCWYKWVDKYENRLVYMSTLGELDKSQKKLYYDTKNRLAHAEQNTHRISSVKESKLQRTNYCWSIANCDRCLLERAKVILDKYYSEYNWSIIEVSVRPENSRSYRLILNGGKSTKDFISTMRERFYDPLCRQNKRVPKEILNSSISIQQSFFDGYYAGDGFRALRDNKNALGFDIMGQIGAQGMCYIVERLGYCINVRRRKGDIYTIHISKRFRRMYPGLVHSVKYLSENKENTVYDVETGNHHLNAGVGGLVVHNCDGIHIEGLLVNLIHNLFPSLLQRETPFVVSMKTPIARVSRPRCKDMLFYDERRFIEYIKTQTQKYTTKYYKGLGTTRAEDVPDTFGKKMVEYVSDDNVTENMNKIFHKKHSDDRKEWLGGYDPSIYDFSLDDKGVTTKMTLSNFLNEEMIKFSHSDCARSLPHGVDGLKESQRKILYAVRKRNLRFQGTSLKVAQLSGYTAEHSNYHHGEQNLQDTIIHMASGYTGTNNIPLLYPDGGFGTRLEGGKDAASARYIYTKLEAMTEYIYRNEDDPLLTQVNDDGDLVQPEHYVPIIPMILVNGCTAGIGTGWSCTIPCYNPKDLVRSIKIWLENDGEILLEDPDDGEVRSILPEITPWYRDFKGDITPDGDNRYITTGAVTKMSSTYNVTELPIGMWTCKFKDMCDDFVADKKLKSVKNHSTVKDVNFTLTKAIGGMPCNVEGLKLHTYVYTSNMVLFTAEGKLKKYDNVDQIIDSFCTVRYDYYAKRKAHQIKSMEHELRYLGNKERFIREVIAEELSIMNEEESTILDSLKEAEYDEDPDSGGYDYLLRMHIRTFTAEKVNQLNKDIEGLRAKLDTTRKTSEKKMWLNDLDDFEKHYDKWVIDMNNRSIKKTKK